MRLRKIALIASVVGIDLVGFILIVTLLPRLFGGPDYGVSKDEPVPIAFMKGDQSIFQTHGNALTYVPHMRGESERVYFTDTDYRVAFDYDFQTNNFGLVQNDDVMPDKASALVLGDSFTEGVGGPPWFTGLAPVIEQAGYQPVNGGIQGTGFHAWWELTRYLEDQRMRIDKLVVVFTSPDYGPFPMAFPDAYLHCLSGRSLRDCNIQKYYFLPLPPPEQLSSWVDEVRKARSVALVAEPTGMFAIMKDNLKALKQAPRRAYQMVRASIAPAADDAKMQREAQARAAIAALISRYGAGNIIFVHVPLKNERTPNADGSKARQAIRAAGGILFDGFKFCQLAVSDYYAIDVHPTEAGYKKISNCVADAFRKLISN